MNSDDTIAISARTLRRLILGVVVTVIVIALLAVLWQQRDRFTTVFDRGLAAQIDAARFQSVVLTGGQVFFGRLTAKGDVFLLTDVFYLTPPAEGASEPGTLVKRGGELHGPTEPLVIPEEQVVFMENLRDDSQVVQAIQRFRSGETAPPASPRPATPTVRPSPSPTR